MIAYCQEHFNPISGVGLSALDLVEIGVATVLCWGHVGPAGRP